MLHAAGGLVLVLAGLGKLRSPKPVSAALKALRLPSSEIAVGLIAGAEIVIGVAGAIAGASWMAWVVAGEWALLALVALLLVRQPQVPCGCFGAAGEPASAVHVLVDLAFAGVAVATALAADVTLTEAADEARGGWFGVTAAAVLLAIAVRRLLVTSIRPEEPALATGPALASTPPAMPAAPPTLDDVVVDPDVIVDSDVIVPAEPEPEPEPPASPAFERVVAGNRPDGTAIEVNLVGGTKQTLLAFLTDTCVTCREFWAAFGDGAIPPGTDVVIVTMGPEDESVELIANLAPSGLPTVMSSQAWDDYGVAAGPYFVLVDPDGSVVTHGPAATVASLDAMLTAAAG